MDGKNVWRTTKKAKIDLQNTSAFAKDDFFYKASPVSLAQVEIIGLLFRDASRRVKDKQVALLKEINAIQRIQSLLSTHQTDDTNIHHHLKVLWSNIIEDKHTAHELAARPILDELAKGEMSVLEDPEAFKNFVVFFAHQLTRTKAIRERALPGNGSWVQAGDGSEYVFEELRKCDWLLGYMTGINVAEGILSTRQALLHKSCEGFIL